MAGDWIKLEHATLDKPEVLELSELLHVSQGDALLLCLRFWVWLDEQSRDGRRLRVSKLSLDALIKCPGFSNSMIRVSWLGEDSEGLFIPNFDKHNGETSKKRALKNQRQSKWRQNGDATVDADVDASRSTKLSTREEKRRDKDISPKRELLAVPDGWTPSEQCVENLSREFGLRVPEDVNRYVAAFHDACKAKGYRYKDFDAAFRNCVRQDWPKLRNGSATSVGQRKVAL